MGGFRAATFLSIGFCPCSSDWVICYIVAQCMGNTFAPIPSSGRMGTRMTCSQALCWGSWAVLALSKISYYVATAVPSDWVQPLILTDTAPWATSFTPSPSRMWMACWMSFSGALWAVMDSARAVERFLVSSLPCPYTSDWVLCYVVSHWHSAVGDTFVPRSRRMMGPRVSSWALCWGSSAVFALLNTSYYATTPVPSYCVFRYRSTLKQRHGRLPHTLSQ